MIRIRAPQNLGAALIFLVVGLAGLYFGAGLPGMTAGAQLGSGTMPRILSGIILCFSAIIFVRALSTDGPAVAHVPWRALAAVSCAVVLFGALIEIVGYFPVAVLTPLAATLALPRVRWREAVLVAVLLGLGTSLLFVILLGQPLKLWWGAE